MAETIVGEQMTAMVDISEFSLYKAGHTSCRLDDTSSWQKQNEVMEATKSSKKHICLLSGCRGEPTTTTCSVFFCHFI